MEYELIGLEKMIGAFLAACGSPAGEKKALEIKKECTMLKLVMVNRMLRCDNEVGLRSFFSLHMQRLVEISDRVFDFDPSQRVVGGEILGLLYSMKKAMPGLLTRDIALPRLFRVLHQESLLQELERVLAESGLLPLEKRVKELVEMPLVVFGDLDRKLSWFHFVWMKRFLAGLKGIGMQGRKEAVKDQVVRLLVGMEFNVDGFWSWWVEDVQLKLGECTERSVFELVLGSEKRKLEQLTSFASEPFFQDKGNILDRLKAWLFEQEQPWQEDGISGVVGIDGGMKELKLRYKMTAEQLAFWMKLQYDLGMYEEPDLSVFSQKIAAHFSSAGQDELSASSIKSKFYPKDVRIISPIYEQVVKMVKDLGELLALLEQMVLQMKPFLR